MIAPSVPLAVVVLRKDTCSDLCMKCEVDRDDAVQLGSALRLASNLRSLSLKNCSLSDDSLSVLIPAACASSLLDLDLGFNYLGETSLAILAKSIGDSRISSLGLSKTLLKVEKNAAFNFLAVLIRNCSSLKVIDMSMNQIGDENFEDFCQSLSTSSIEVLNLQINRLSNNGATFLSQAMRNLRKLNLQFNSISDEGIVALSNSLLTSQLEDLNLCSNKVGSIGVEALASAIKKSRTLTKLALAYCELSSSSAVLLAQAVKENNTMVEMDLSHNLHLGKEVGEAFYSITLRTHRCLTALNLSFTSVAAPFKLLIEERIRNLHSNEAKICVLLCWMTNPRVTRSARRVALPIDLVRKVANVAFQID